VEMGGVDARRLCFDKICKLKQDKKRAKAVKDFGEDYQ
jgi:hypothetical protein